MGAGGQGHTTALRAKLPPSTQTHGTQQLFDSINTEQWTDKASYGVACKGMETRISKTGEKVSKLGHKME